jgi:hypothetical protein
VGGAEALKLFQQFSAGCETVKTVSDEGAPWSTALKRGVNGKVREVP